MNKFKLIYILSILVAALNFSAGSALAEAVSQDTSIAAPASTVPEVNQTELIVVYVESTSFTDSVKVVELDAALRTKSKHTLVTLPAASIRRLEAVVSRSNEINIVYQVYNEDLYHFMIPNNDFTRVLGPKKILAPWMAPLPPPGPLSGGRPSVAAIDFALDIDEATGEVLLAATWNWFNQGANLLPICLGRKPAGHPYFTITVPHIASGGWEGGGVGIARNNSTNTIHISFNPYQINLAPSATFPASFEEIVIDQNNNVTVQNINGTLRIGAQKYFEPLGQFHILKPTMAVIKASPFIALGVYVNSYINPTVPSLGWNQTPQLVSPTGYMADLLTHPRNASPILSVLAVIEGGLMIAPQAMLYVGSNGANWSLPMVIDTKGGYTSISMSKIISPRSVAAELSIVTARRNFVNMTKELEVHVGLGGWRRALLATIDSSSDFSIIRTEWLH